MLGLDSRRSERGEAPVQGDAGEPAGAVPAPGHLGLGQPSPHLRQPALLAAGAGHHRDEGGGGERRHHPPGVHQHLPPLPDEGGAGRIFYCIVSPNII